MRTVAETIAALGKPEIRPSRAPAYTGTSARGIALAVESMRTHTTDEGWQIMYGLAKSGYTLCGRRLAIDAVDVPMILELTNPGVVFVQDKREWHFPGVDFRDPTATFERFEVLRDRPDLFKLTIVKDSQQRPEWHKESADEIGCHAWVIYYEPRIVLHLAPYLRPEHVIRTYHSINSHLVPPFTTETRKDKPLLSGAMGSCYPIREILKRRQHQFRIDVLNHPGYDRKFAHTPEYLKHLSTYKVAICTSSIYGYALRKIIEATACGCTVITDLPSDEVLPEIDGNLVRIDRKDLDTMPKLFRHLIDRYDPEKQREYARRAKAWYDYREVGRRLALDIEKMRSTYHETQPVHPEPDRSLLSGSGSDSVRSDADSSWPGENVGYALG